MKEKKSFGWKSVVSIAIAFAIALPLYTFAQTAKAANSSTLLKEPLPSVPFDIDQHGAAIATRSAQPVSGVVYYVPSADQESGRIDVNPLDLLVGPNARCNQDGFGSWQNEISISGSPISTSNALSGANDYRNGDGSAGFYRSTNGGANWSDALITRGPAGVFEAAGDPVCVIDRNGKMFASYIAFDRTTDDNGLYVQTSVNNGTSWTAPVAVIQHIGGGVYDFEDKPYGCADISVGSPYLGRFYITWTKFLVAGGSPIYFSRSLDGGATFSAGIQISAGTNCQFSCPTVGPNGEIYVTWVDGGNIKFRKSLDGGTTWQAEVNVTSYNSGFPANPCGTFRHITYPVAGADISGGANNGNVYIAYGTNVSSSPEVYFTRSTNGGVNWSAPFRVNDVATGWQYHHWMAVNPTNGRIGVAWHDTREDAGACQYKQYGTISDNGGTSFPAAAPISTVASNPSASTFLGDYNGVSFNGSDFFAGWTDLRNDAGDAYSATFAPDVVAPANDACPGQYVTLPYAGSGSTQFAAQETANCLGNTSRDVFYYFYNTGCTDAITVSLCGSGYDCALEVLDGCSGTSLYCNDDFCGLQSTITFTPNINTYYYVRVFGFGTNSGNYTINISQAAGAPPVNDNCTGSTVITALPYTDNGSTCSAANDYSFCFMQLSRDVVYTLVVQECQSITVSTCGGQTNYDTRLTVRTGGACPGTTEIGCNDDFCGLQSQITFDATANVAYYIVVAGFDVGSGLYTLTATSNGHVGSPANDNCSGAIAVNALPYNHSGNTTCAVADYAFSGCGFEDSRDVVYRLNLPSCQTVQVSTCTANASYDTRIQVMAGGSCPGNTLIACNDDFCGLQSTVTFGALANTDYYILVRGYWSGAFGPYDLSITSVGGFVSPNDLCPGTAINAIPYVGFGNTVCSSDNYANGDCYFSESSPEDVYSLTLAATQGVSISLCGSGYDTGLKVRRGGACPGDVMVVCDDDASCNSIGTLQSNVEFTAQAGVTYFVQVSGYITASGPYTIRVEPKTINPIDSLVIKEVTGTVQLWWEDLHASLYVIYRSADPNTLYSPLNLHGSTVATTFTEYEALSDEIYYGVTYVPNYMIPALMAAGLGERPIQEVFAAAMDELKLTAIPVEPVDFYSGVVAEDVELAPAGKKATVQPEGVHMFGSGVSIENPVPGKNYKAE